MIDCKEVLARLYDYLDRELSEAQAGQVAEHLKDCRACFDRMEFERLLGEFVNRAGHVPVDTSRLRLKIRERLQQLEAAEADESEALGQDPGGATGPLSEEASDTAAHDAHKRRVPVWSYFLAAAAVVLIALPIIRQFAAKDTPATLGRLVSLHLERPPEIEDSDPARLSAWVEARKGHDPMAREFAQAGCVLKGAAVDSVFSQLYLERSGTPVSVFVAAQDRFVVPKQAVPVRIDGELFWTVKAGDLSVVIWAWHPTGVICAAVARLDADAIIKLARQAEALMPAPGGA